MTVKKNLFIFLILGGLFAAPLISQERTDGIDQRGQQLVYTPAQQKLLIPAENIKIIREEDESKGGFHLYVKKTEGIESILLTETTKDPYGKIDNYAYRAKEYNPINGDEIRILDGKKLESKYAQYSLVDSTVEDTDFFVPAFHIYIPDTLVYGYEWSRHGEIKIGKGTFISIRAYSKPYADYSGDYLDNPFMFDLIKRKIPKPAPIAPEPEPLLVLTDEYNPVASEKFKEITDDEMIYSKGPETIVEDILGIIVGFDKTKPLDFVLAIDATGSMKDDIDELKARLKPALRKLFGESHDARFGLLFYRDYGDTYKYMGLPVKLFVFTQSYNNFQQNLDSIYIRGTEGGDVPEAVYEALYASCAFYTWRPEADRHVILIGDAEPHPFPRGSGKYSKEYVMGVAKEKGIKTHAILLPNK
ncbi:MAG: VWA domain-containing protein [Treponema sp.]|nr:VWA domain-containing protein [Treponema sp.]